ncbi:universal stress protein [Amorphoplanes nipponensis]|uniref:Universal stress protein n=1 Tax=Actinoplanes nipponensis TaxID=135950 RepID=A0A919JSF0_9ACTN|nr:universal stress protein [Actinoplanes nipponensis]GIE54540.1 universal stress protein [Actinoplanes nipponensis]
MRYRTIIVGTDGSESALTAVDQAAEIAAALSVRLVVVCAYHPLTAKEQSYLAAVVGPISMYQVAGTDAAKEALASARERAAAAGAADVVATMVKGDPGQALLTVARQESADLIVVGNRGINTLSGRLLGSVPSDVTQRAPCDVLVVHTVEGGTGDAGGNDDPGA